MLPTNDPAPRQVLVRLPHSVAAQLAQRVPPRQRNRYIVELLARDLERQGEKEAEERQLIEAAESMNRLEAEDPEFAREAQELVEAKLTRYLDDEDFDRAQFEREFAEAQARYRVPPLRLR